MKKMKAWTGYVRMDGDKRMSGVIAERHDCAAFVNYFGGRVATVLVTELPRRKSRQGKARRRKA